MLKLRTLKVFYFDFLVIWVALCLFSTQLFAELPFQKNVDIRSNSQPYLPIPSHLPQFSPETQKKILSERMPQPDPEVFGAMPSVFRELALRYPERAWNPDSFYGRPENLEYGKSFAPACELEKYILGSTPYTRNETFPQWKVNAISDFSDFIHGGSIGNPGLRYLIRSKLGMKRTALGDAIAKEFLAKYLDGKNLPPIRLGEGEAKVESGRDQNSLEYHISVPQDPDDVSPYTVIRHELDHLLAADPTRFRRCFGRNQTQLSTSEFISLADAALQVLFYQEELARAQLASENISHPTQNISRYRSLLREIKRRPEYSEPIRFPSGYEISLGDLAEMARAGGYDVDETKIKNHFVESLLHGKSLLTRMIFNGRENDPEYFKTRRFSGGLTLTGPTLKAAPN